MVAARRVAQGFAFICALICNGKVCFRFVLGGVIRHEGPSCGSIAATRARSMIWVEANAGGISIPVDLAKGFFLARRKVLTLFAWNLMGLCAICLRQLKLYMEHIRVNPIESFCLQTQRTGMHLFPFD